jgi:hypothetical protein
VLKEDSIPNLLKKLSYLNYEIHDFEVKLEGRISLKLWVLKELKQFGLTEQSDFKVYLDENPPIKLELKGLELSRRRWGTDR